MADSLYFLSQELKTVIEGGVVFDEETGEVYFDSSNIEDLAITTANKVEAVSMYSQGRRVLAKARKEAAKAMADSAKLLEAEADRLDEYALSCVKTVGGKIETPSMTVSVRKCPKSVEVVDESLIPIDYIKQKVSLSVDKKAVKDALMAGEDVPGACLVQNERLSVR